LSEWREIGRIYHLKLKKKKWPKDYKKMKSNGGRQIRRFNGGFKTAPALKKKQNKGPINVNRLLATR